MASNYYDFFEEEFDEGSAYAFLTDQMRSIKVEINNKDCHYLGIITNTSNPNIDKATGELEQLAVELVASVNSK